MPPLKVLNVFGTRPEAVKMAPVVRALQQRPDEFETLIAVTAQHRTMLDQILRGFDITPHFDLNIMQHGQSLTEITNRVLQGLAPILEDTSPDIVLVQGDTTTVFAASLAAFYGYSTGKRTLVGHVEAGLRTENKFDPFPEEMNRRLTTCLADIHFAPTRLAKANLLRYGVPEESIYITGNTVIDALLYSAALPDYASSPTPRDSRFLLVTAHRRENWGEPLRNICRAIRDIVERFSELQVIFSMHKNPIVRAVVMEELAGRERVHLIEPPDYFDFVKLMRDAYLILTDSGGVQEEAPSLGKPVLVMRRTTERPEGVEAGTAKLVGTAREDIVEMVTSLLESPTLYEKMARAVNPYGDGKAAERIVQALLHFFGRSTERPADFAPARQPA